VLNVENYIRAIVLEDKELVKIFEHLNSLVLTEVATTCAQINVQVERLAQSSEEIREQFLSQTVRQTADDNVSASCIA
jgi:arginyl-tRNA synthetase